MMPTLKKLIYLALLLFPVLSGCASKDLPLIREEAYLAYQNNDYVTAADKFEVLVQKAPGDVEFWFRLGNSYARSMQPQQAIAAYQNALLRDPKNEKAWYNMGLIQTQAALKTFVDMQEFATPESPIGQRGKSMREGLFILLGHENERKEKE